MELVSDKRSWNSTWEKVVEIEKLQRVFVLAPWWIKTQKTPSTVNGRDWSSCGFLGAWVTWVSWLSWSFSKEDHGEDGYLHSAQLQGRADCGCHWLGQGVQMKTLQVDVFFLERSTPGSAGSMEKHEFLVGLPWKDLFWITKSRHLPIQLPTGGGSSPVFFKQSLILVVFFF